MDYIEFSNSIKEKYPYYKDADNGELARKMLEKYPYYKDKVDTSNIDSDYQKKTEQMVGYPQNQPETYDKTAQVLFPRTSKTDPIIDPAKQQLASLGLDLLSLPGRVSMSGPRTYRQTSQDIISGKPVIESIKDIPRKIVENVSFIETPSEKGALTTASNIVEDIGRNPATIIPGPGRIGGTIAKIAPKLTLVARESVPAMVQGLGRVLAEGGTQVGIGESNRLAEGRDLGEGTPLEYGLEGGLGLGLGLVPGLRSWAKESAEKSAGKGINYKDYIMGGTPQSAEKSALGARDLMKNWMGKFYNPEKSIQDNAQVFVDLVEYNPNFSDLKNSDAVKSFFKSVNEQLPKTGSEYIPYLAANLVKNVPFVGKPAASAILASKAVEPFQNVPKTAVYSSLGRGLGSTLLQNLNAPEQDQVSRFRKFIGTDSTKQ